MNATPSSAARTEHPPVLIHGLVLSFALTLAPTIAVPYIAQPAGPYCAVAAVAMVGRAAGLTLDFGTLVREVPVHRDGVSWLDLHLALERRGAGLLVGRANHDEVAALLATGHPVVVAVRSGAQAKHVWVVTAQTPTGYDVLDPADATRRTVTRAGLDAVWLAGEVVVLAGGVSQKRPWPALQASTRRYFAAEWARRAVANGTLDTHPLALLDRAVAADPTLPELLVGRARVLQALGRTDAARDAVATALRLRPEDAEAHALAVSLGVVSPAAAH